MKHSKEVQKERGYLMGQVEVLKVENDKERTVNLELTPEEFQKIQRLLEINEAEEKEVQKHEEETKNHNFIQLYRENMAEVRWLMANHKFASSLLFFILEHMDNRNALACSYTVFEDYFEKSRTTVYRGIKTLQDNGFVDVLKMGTSNVYVVNENLAWSDRNDLKKYVKYDGKILVSRKDNKDYEYRSRFDKLKTLRERENLK